MQLIKWICIHQCRLPSEVKLSFHLSPACTELSSDIPVNFEMVKALKTALSECIPFCFKGGILEIGKLNLKAHLCVCVYVPQKGRFILHSDYLKGLYICNITVNQFTSLNPYFVHKRHSTNIYQLK